jgi:hypothetical protein
MTLATEIYQGDSSDVIAVSVYYNEEAVADLTGYTATLSVVSCLGADPLIEKSMNADDSVFTAQIAPDESEELDVGSYIIIAQVENLDLDFRKEQHIALEVLKQGYTA